MRSDSGGRRAGEKKCWAKIAGRDDHHKTTTQLNIDAANKFPGVDPHLCACDAALFLLCLCNSARSQLLRPCDVLSRWVLSWSCIA